MLVEIYRMHLGANRHLAIRSIRDCVEGGLSDLDAAAVVDRIIAHNDVDASAANATPGKFKLLVKDDVGSTDWDTFKGLFDVYEERPTTDMLRLWKVTVDTKIGPKNHQYTRLILASTFQLAHDYGQMGLSSVNNSWVTEVLGPFEEGQILFEVERK